MELIKQGDLKRSEQSCRSLGFLGTDWGLGDGRTWQGWAKGGMGLGRKWQLA